MEWESNLNKKRKEPESSSEEEEAGGDATMEGAAAAAEERKSIYMFFSHGFGPIVHSLYVVDLPQPLLPVDIELDVDGSWRTPESKLLRPVLELSGEQYPWGMDCVELDSKFYFIGGRSKQIRNFFGPVPLPNFYIFNPNHQTPLLTSGGGSDLRLVEGPKMKTGKIMPWVFVADRKIYVLSAVEPDMFRGKLTLFEYFDPRVGKWFELKPPPFRSFITFQTVINRKVFVLSDDRNVYGRQFCYFDLDCNEWFVVPGYCPEFCDRAEFVDGTLYTCYIGGVVVSCGPLPSSSSKEEELFQKNLTALMPKVIHPNFPASRLSNSLRHIGNRRFCYVGSCSTSAPTDPEEVHRIGLTVFEALKDTYTEGDQSFFKANLLHSACFHIITHTCSSTYLVDCFALPCFFKRC